MFKMFCNIEPRIILKLFLNTKGVTWPKKFKEYIPIFVDVLLHHKTKQELIFCIDDAKAS